MFHCSANVLLDVACRAKLGDFGLARSLTDTSSKTKHIVGTSGYIPPEYYRGVVSIKMDSFGFGVASSTIITYYTQLTSVFRYYWR